MNQIIEVSEHQLEMMQNAGIEPIRTINPYESLFDMLIQDAANMVGSEYDSDTVDELKLNSSKLAKELFNKIFHSNTNDFEDIIDATAIIYERIEREVVKTIETEIELLSGM